MAPCRRFMRIREAFVKISLAIVVEVVKPRDLVSAQHEDLSVRDNQSQRLVETRRDPPPTHPVERFVETVYVPDIALNRAEHGRAVWQKVVAAEKQERVPGIAKRTLNRIDDIGPRARLPQRALGR